MSLFGKVKNFFRQPINTEIGNKFLPEIVQIGVTSDIEWTKIGELGDGAFGKVEKVENIKNPKLLAAAKHIEFEDGEDIDDYITEVEILETCKHENIVKLLACYYQKNQLSILLEFCSGGAIDNIMLELNRSLTEKQISYVTHYTCVGLNHLHKNNVIHRDMKAGNILLTGDGVVKLADFGVSTILKSKESRSDSFIGTPYWMAPEVIICETFKDSPYNYLADIWSLGITCIEMAQCDPPFHNMSPPRVLLKIQKSDPPTLDNPDKWSNLFVDFLTKCLQKIPENRQPCDILLSHPFIKESTSKKLIFDLLAEINATVQEEIIDEESEKISNDSNSIVEEDVNEGHEDEKKNINNFIEEPVNGQFGKTRKAPLPPTIYEFDEDNSDELVFNHNTSTSSNEVHDQSPVRDVINDQDQENINTDVEAIEILDSLCDTLNKEYGEQSLSKVSYPSVSSMTNSYKYSKDNDAMYYYSDEEFDNDICNTKEEIISNNENCKVPRPSIEAIPHGLVAKNIETVGNEIKFDKSLLRANHLRESRKKEDLDKLISSAKVSQIAASFKVVPPKEPECTTLELRGPSNKISPIEIENITNSKEGSIDHNINKLNEDDNDNDSVSTLATNAPPEPPVDYNEEQYCKELKILQRSEDILEENKLLNDININKNVESSLSKESEKYDEYSNGTVVYENDQMSNVSVSIDNKENSKNNFDFVRNKNRKTISKKTRTFIVDGVEVTSTTMTVLGRNGADEIRKRQLRELKKAQRFESRQTAELTRHTEQIKEQQERKFENEKLKLIAQYDGELEALSKLQKKKMEELEKLQEEDVRLFCKKIKSEQERDYKLFKESLKHEQKLLKQEMDVIHRSHRKDVYRQRKEILDKEQENREIRFLSEMDNNHKTSINRLQTKHKEKNALMEKQFLEQRHDLIRCRENALWELMERQLEERHILYKHQLQEQYYVRRANMIRRHGIERDFINTIHQNIEEAMYKDIILGQKKMPKTLKAESRTRIAMFKESLKISMSDQPSSVINEKIKEFEEQEKHRIKKQLHEYKQRCHRRYAQMVTKNRGIMKELEEIQDSKRVMLKENEITKEKDYDNTFTHALTTFRESLPQRKMQMETEFLEELRTAEGFYGTFLTGMDLQKRG
ncbi:Sterile20-like kinase [Strongyloides ratti]|uniref:Sterile20-like kinase n=1 Tax=Strongyloides ratti TaxID=34506 RepID=A0A090MPE7_STRRB|nr:Sterile20-like kinase [Strongyloides ratti]CEF59982.1 Sterile20-like kinase [Strongyloides ratti]